MKRICKPVIWFWSSFDTNESRGTWVPLSIVIVFGLGGVAYGLVYGKHRSTMYVVGSALIAACLGMILVVLLLSFRMWLADKKAKKQKQTAREDPETTETQ